MARVHPQDELTKSTERITVRTPYGTVKGGRAANGAAVFLEIPYALPPDRFEDPKPLPADYRYEDQDYIYESKWLTHRVLLLKPRQIIRQHRMSSELLFNVEVPSQSLHPWRIDDNFGFKDQWLALLWIRDNIEKFGGMSSCCLLRTFWTIPKTPTELRPQFEALCKALNLDPSSPHVLAQLRDTIAFPWDRFTHVIEKHKIGKEFESFRGTLDGAWLATSPDDLMTWQRSGGFARALRTKGVRSIVVGDLTEEWFLYSIAHPITTAEDVVRNVRQYYPSDIMGKLFKCYSPVPEGATQKELAKYMGEVLADGRVHFPVRLLARDLLNAGFPMLRYEIRWTPEQFRPLDQALWMFRLPTLEPSQAVAARTWLDVIDAETKALQEGMNANARDPKNVLALNEDKTISWRCDDKWGGLMRLRMAIPTEAGPAASAL
ncbi:alpha/beta-hydrolase [Daedalea quercina L-15889]|uniref:Alpha/beta-hydrolase n=1 Tax=Daedalea quercina L-15889 TaxID=1314783 RepID=A0A165MXD7_9APHY|nr:alpha/beta-hydrolase [Daedalea quercina L-15889]